MVIGHCQKIVIYKPMTKTNALPLVGRRRPRRCHTALQPLPLHQCIALPPGYPKPMLCLWCFIPDRPKLLIPPESCGPRFARHFFRRAAHTLAVTHTQCFGNEFRSSRGLVHSRFAHPRSNFNSSLFKLHFLFSFCHHARFLH